MNKNKTIVVVFLGILVVVAGAYFLWQDRDMLTTPLPQNKSANQSQDIVSPESIPKGLAHLITLKTNFGDIQFMTYDADAPKTVANFVSLTKKNFYDGLTFHRVIKGFMIQGGDPNCGTNPANVSGPCGTGGPGYKFEDELNPNTESYKAGYKKGVVAMANAGPNTNGSQFFIMLADYPLPNNYSIFGKVIKGQEIVDAIGNTKTGEGDRPVSAVTIQSVSVEELLAE